MQAKATSVLLFKCDTVHLGWVTFCTLLNHYNPGLILKVEELYFHHVTYLCLHFLKRRPFEQNHQEDGIEFSCFPTQGWGSWDIFQPIPAPLWLRVAFGVLTFWHIQPALLIDWASLPDSWAKRNRNVIACEKTPLADPGDRSHSHNSIYFISFQTWIRINHIHQM